MSARRPVFEPTANPCPAWCEQPVGHGYDSQTEAGAVARGHALDLGYLDLGNDDRAVCPDLRPGEVWVSIWAQETADDDAGANVLVEAPGITLYAERATLSAAQAREVAAMLTAAADRLDEIERASLPGAAWDSCPNGPRVEDGR